ncbi:MAG: GDP-mannose 4,6-dehydratase [Candidatus Aminicenantes bacterium]|nr:GDP-mannose 4,6-dehydratase [Candidatus Aminicenantes bacterium]
MRAVVTGAAGFIGSILCERLLKEGWKIIGVDCFRDYYSIEIKKKNIANCLRSSNFTLIEEDISISSLDFIKEGDFIFHLAAQPGVRKSWGSEFQYYINDNIVSTQRLLEKVKKIKISKFIFASSSSVYGQSKSFPLREDSLTLPFSPYGVTKLAGENLAILYHGNFGVPVVSLRFFTVFGRRQRPDMAFHKAMKSIITGEEFTVYGDGTQVRDFTHVDDTIEGIILAAERGKPGHIYNLGSEREITLVEALNIIEKVTGKRIKIRKMQWAKGDVSKTLASIEKARKELGYGPKKTMEEGIEEEWNWIKDIYNSNI